VLKAAQGLLRSSDTDISLSYMITSDLVSVDIGVIDEALRYQIRKAFQDSWVFSLCNKNLYHVLNK